MKHDERISIANDFTKKVVEKYGSDIVTVAIAGPVAENKDGDNADLDLMVVTKKALIQPYHYMFKDCAIEPTYISMDDLEKVASTPIGINGGPMPVKDSTYLVGRNWLRWAYLFNSSFKVLYGSDAPIKTFNKTAASIPMEKFKAQARHELPYVRASINHIRGGSAPMGHVVEFLKLVYEVVAMLNGTFYKTHNQFDETKSFKVLPKDFHQLVTTINSTAVSNKQELDKAMMQLNENVLKVCEENGAGIEYYDDLAKMKV